MDARYYNGGPDDDDRAYPDDREPVYRRCDTCGRLAKMKCSFARMWWFCCEECKDNHQRAQKAGGK